MLQLRALRRVISLAARHNVPRPPAGAMIEPIGGLPEESPRLCCSSTVLLIGLAQIFMGDPR